MNETSHVMPLEITYEPTSIGKLRFMLIIETSLKSMYKMGFTDSDTDDVKGIFFDTNIYLLLLTVFVTSFHVKSKPIQMNCFFSNFYLKFRFYLIFSPLRTTFNSGATGRQWRGCPSVHLCGELFPNL